MAVPEPPPFSVASAEGEDRVVLTLAGELDLSTAHLLEEPLLARLHAGDTVVVDLRGLQFMDSSGVRVLVTGHTAAQSGPGTLIVVRAPRDGEVDRVIEISGIAGALQMVDEP